MARSKASSATPSLTERLEIRLSLKEKKTFQAAAARHGISLSQWLRLAAWRIVNEHEGQVKLLELDK